MPVIPSRIRAGLAADEAPFAVDGHVVLVTKVGDRDIDKARVLLALPGRPGL